MAMLTLIETLLLISALSWAIWFQIGLVRYIINHEGEVDNRLQIFCGKA